ACGGDKRTTEAQRTQRQGTQRKDKSIGHGQMPGSNHFSCLLCVPCLCVLCASVVRFYLSSLNRMFLKVTSIVGPWCSCQAIMPSSGSVSKSASTVVSPLSLIVMCLPTHLIE